MPTNASLSRQGTVHCNALQVHSVTFSELHVKLFVLKEVGWRSSEGRSVGKVCEAFLKASCENYKKKGTTLLKRFLAQRRQKQKET
jgi:hypothetical protein